MIYALLLPVVRRPPTDHLFAILLVLCCHLRHLQLKNGVNKSRPFLCGTVVLATVLACWHCCHRYFLACMNHFDFLFMVVSLQFSICDFAC